VICTFYPTSTQDKKQCLFHQAHHLKIPMSQKADDQGFLTNLDRYVNRIEAAKIAINAGQVNDSIKILFSEDLWNEPDGGRYDYCELNGYMSRKNTEKL
jgi:hypothetical protein